jgi:hypothetical protein
LFPLLPRPALAGKGGAEGQGILKNPHSSNTAGELPMGSNILAIKVPPQWGGGPQSGSGGKIHKVKTDDFEIRFKLQAYASMYFNEYTIKRRQK